MHAVSFSGEDTPKHTTDSRSIKLCVEDLTLTAPILHQVLAAPVVVPACSRECTEIGSVEPGLGSTNFSEAEPDQMTRPDEAGQEMGRQIQISVGTLVVQHFAGLAVGMALYALEALERGQHLETLQKALAEMYW